MACIFKTIPGFKSLGKCPRLMTTENVTTECSVWSGVVSCYWDGSWEDNSYTISMLMSWFQFLFYGLRKRISLVLGNTQWSSYEEVSVISIIYSQLGQKERVSCEREENREWGNVVKFRGSSWKVISNSLGGWMCILDISTDKPKTPMLQTHGRSKASSGWGSERWQSLLWSICGYW